MSKCTAPVDSSSLRSSYVHFLPHHQLADLLARASASPYRLSLDVRQRIGLTAHLKEDTNLLLLRYFIFRYYGAAPEYQAQDYVYYRPVDRTTGRWLGRSMSQPIIARIEGKSH